MPDLQGSHRRTDPEPEPIDAKGPCICWMSDWNVLILLSLFVLIFFIFFPERFWSGLSLNVVIHCFHSKVLCPSFRWKNVLFSISKKSSNLQYYLLFIYMLRTLTLCWCQIVVVCMFCVWNTICLYHQQTYISSLLNSCFWTLAENFDDCFDWRTPSRSC